MSTIQLRTLGTLDLRAADGRELHSLLAQPKRIALLAYLCIAEPRGYHRRDTLLGLFWPDSDQEHARTSLRKSVHILRRVLGEDSILSRGDEEVGADFERIRCDVTSFVDLVKANRPEDALELYGGDLLPGFFLEDSPEFEQWLSSERIRLRASAARAAYSAAEVLEKRGDHVGATPLARRSLDLAATDERALRKLVELQCKAGDRAAALATYESFARVMAAEYQTQPSAETRSLVERIRAGKEDQTLVPRANAQVAGDYPAVSPAPMTERNQQRGPRRQRMVIAAAALGVLIFSGFIVRALRPRSSTQVLRYALVVDSSEAMVQGDGWWGRLAISPDGTHLAYIGGANNELLVRPRSQLRAVTISGTKGAQTPFFSPDGKRVGFLGEEHVYIASTNGDLPVMVCDSLTGVAGASWARDGFIYVDGRAYRSLVRVEAKPRARPHYFTTLDTAAKEIDHTWPDVLPNGKGVIFSVTITGTHGVTDSLSYAIAVADIPSGKHHVIVNDAKYARYATSGHLLYITTGQTLMVAPFDQNSMKVTGPPTALIENMRLGRFGSADLAVSESGTLVYATGGTDKRELVWINRDGSKQSVDPNWQGDFWGLALSPDGKRVAVGRRLGGQRVDVWVKQLDRGPSVRLTTQQDWGFFPAWTPDGTSVTYMSPETDGTSALQSRADGSGPAVLQFRNKEESSTPIWSPDGRWMVFRSGGPPRDSGNIVGIRPGIDTSPVTLVASPSWEVTPALSPDGRWLAYSSSETGQNEIFVVPFPDTRAAKWAISNSGGTDPAWAHRGNELFYRDGAGNLVAVEVTTTPTFSPGRATVLFSTVGLEMRSGLKQYAVSPDDRRFLMIRPAIATPEKVIVVENWFEELQAKPSS